MAKIEDPDVLDSDFNGDSRITLDDSILALQVVSSQPVSNKLYLKSDVNNDDKIGIEEAIYNLQKVSGLR